MPFRIVLDRSRDDSSVARTPRRIKPVRTAAVTKDARNPPLFAPIPIKNRVISMMRVGKRPLHGTMELVRMAISLSRGESIIRQPTTPAALQPKPIAMSGH